MDFSDLESALALPLAEDTSLDTAAVGVLATLASFVTPLAGIVLVGYVVRLVRAGGRTTTALPAFDEFGGVVVDGVRLSGVLVALQLPAVGIAVAVAKLAGASFATLVYAAEMQSLHVVGHSVLVVVGLVAAGGAALVGTYFSAAATVAVARERSLVAAVPTTRELASDMSFVPVVSAVALVVFAGRLLAALFGALPLVGSVLAALVSFFALVASAALLGRGASKLAAHDSASRPDSTVDAVGSA
ncbi:hypothetical protein C453_05574 [Haloferax elongans ATCC BAA-1513]|uniref:DUF4013 domain-containing protein n=1 Tax=Haloferax elongans ATCC BAA-1513 TaxID=1230453 RepID=M0HSB2_HALEO|nr:DUF4013 domain-containing protein [Haloferax elongans]ELZ86582.1 hypothetical protein C453_05574 [Haloferax elongans ATCC BAA-1513]